MTKGVPVERRIRQVILPHHPQLGRNVNHDSMSRAFRVQPTRADVVRAVRHEAFIPVLDQGSLGSCTGNSGVAAMYRRPFVSGVVKPWAGYPPNQEGAVNLYSHATSIDPFPGEYPPTDTGSDGLSIAKVLKKRGHISGYLWAFTIGEALAQLGDTPVITGVPWFNSMFETTSDGHAGHVVIRADSGMAGGHEICVDEVILPGGVASMPMADVLAALDRVWVGGPNSWGPGFGDQGRWYWTAAEWAWLLARQGDVTAFVANTAPAPEPDPGTDDEAERLAGGKLWRKTEAWAKAHYTGSNARAATAVRAWARETGRA